MAKRSKRSGVVKPKTKGLRTCAGCGAKKVPTDLLRFVVDPDGRLFVDRYQKAPGRGVHLCYDANCLTRVMKNRGLERGLKCTIPNLNEDGLRMRIVDMLETRVEDLLSIAGVARHAVSGMDTLSRSVSRLKGVVVASDVAVATRQKLEGWASSRGFSLVEYGSADSLGRTQGKPNRVAVGICQSQTWQKLTVEVERRKRVLVAASSGKS